MINFQGIVKPTFHAFRFLHLLGDRLLATHVDHGVVTKSSTSGKLSAILFHYPPEMTKGPPISYHVRDEAEATLAIGRSQKKSLKIEGLKPYTGFRIEKLIPDHAGDVVSLWEKAGSPTNLSLRLRRELSDFASNLDSVSVFADAKGVLMYEEDLAPWTILCIVQR